MASETRRYSAPAAGCAADALLTLAREGPATLPELAGRTGATRSLLYRVLAELERRHCVARTDDGRYSLGVAAIELGGAYSRGVPFLDSVRRVLRELAHESGETASLGTLRGADVLYLMREEGARSIFAVSRPGKLLPANATALGKALLARHSDDAVADRLATHASGGLPRLTDRTIVSVEDLLVDLGHTRRRGWALEEGETVRGRCCVAVAVTCAVEGLDDLAVGLSTERTRLRAEGQDLVRLVIESGARIEREVQARVGSGSTTAGGRPLVEIPAVLFDGGG
jgi:DNA-binding IclR family transcriptional regulator